MEQQNRLFRIGISGSYGGMNLGDEAILDGIVTNCASPSQPRSRSFHGTLRIR